MANKYFQQFREKEFQLYNGLSNEAVEMYGVNVFYLPKTAGALDYLFGEDPLVHFDVKFEVTMYLENIGRWEGQGEMFAKFGMEIKDEATFKIQIDQFKKYTGMDRPMIGDLLYVPWQKDKMVLEISHVDMESPFYQSGNVSLFTIKSTRLKYTQHPMPALETDADIGPDIETLISTNDGLDDVPKLEGEVEEDNVIDDSEVDPLNS